MVKAADVNLRFRDGSPEDAASVSDLGTHTYTENFSNIYKKSDLDAYLRKYFSVERVHQDLCDPEIDYRVAESSSLMVGYAKVGPPCIEFKQTGRNILQLHRLYVRETRQGVGVGGILLSWAIDRARERGAEELCLGVWANNENAIKLYQNRGFEAERTYDIDVGNTKDKEVVMSLKLKEKINA